MTIGLARWRATIERLEMLPRRLWRWVAEERVIRDSEEWVVRRGCGSSA